MRWFRHRTDCWLDPAFRKLASLYGEEGFMAAYGRVWRLYELVAGYARGELFELPPDYGWGLLSQDLMMPTGDLPAFLGDLAATGLIDKDAWSQAARVSVPSLADAADQYTRRKITKSEKCTDNVCTCTDNVCTCTNTVCTPPPLSPREGAPAREHPLSGGAGNEAPDAAQPSGRRKVDDPVVYTGTYFDLKRSHYDRLRKRASLLSDEQFEDFLDRLELYAGDHPEKYKRRANGKLANPSSILLRWLSTETFRPAGPAPESPRAAAAPANVEPLGRRADKGCGDCGGKGVVPEPGGALGKVRFKVCPCVQRA